MANPNHPQPQFMQNLQPPYRPPLPNQSVPYSSQEASTVGQGSPKMANVPPQVFQGQHGMMNSSPVGIPQFGAPVPPQQFGSAPQHQSLTAGNMNGFPPPSQGPVMRGPFTGMVQSGGTAPPMSAVRPGNVHPPVQGQYVPPSSYNSPPPFSTIGNMTMNGMLSTPPSQGQNLRLPGGQAPNRFQHPSSVTQTLGGSMPIPPVSLTSQPGLPPASTIGLHKTVVSAPPPVSSASSFPSAIGQYSASPSSKDTSFQPQISGANSPSKGPTSLPNELPVPFHGQAQYSHQIGATMKLTPVPTPSNSEPPSQRSSRGPSPVNEQSYDALEGQFTPGHGAPSPLPPQPGVPSNPLPGPTVTTTQVPYYSIPNQGMPQASSAAMSQAHTIGARVPPPLSNTQQQGMGLPPPLRPGLPGPPSMGIMGPAHPPPPGPVLPPPPRTIGQQPRTGYPQMIQPPYPGQAPLGPGGQPGTPPGPYNTGPPPLVQGVNQGGIYSQPRTTLPGPMTGLPPSSGPPSGPTGTYQQPQAGRPTGQGYPQQPGLGQNIVNNMAGDFGNMAINDSQRPLNLLQEKRLLPADGVETPHPHLYHDHKKVNCSPDIFRCTLNAIPQTSGLLNKARLPLGILIHPFKDLSYEDELQLPVIQSSVIVRCRSCRTYINPFVTFVDHRRWKCNLCFRVNEMPDEFSFDPVTKTYGDPQRRPEIKSATIEFIAPSEYMLRPPQPAIYLFVLDVSFNAVDTGYLRLFSQVLLEELERLPGDARTQIGFLCFDSSLYFFNLSEGLSQPQMLIVPDLEDVFLPCPDNLLTNIHESKEMITELLNQLPQLFEGNNETGSALGVALQAAFKLMTSTGGRITVMQTTLPTVGQGALESRQAGSQAAGLNASNMGPATDFYKKLALDCSAQQIAVDLFMLNGQYADIASVSCISKYSAGSVHYYPSFHTTKNPGLTDKFEADFRRYLTRKIGFESVMRIRCTRGLSIHTFHGNFFVRSTDLLSLPNVNPDAGFGMQMSIEENLTESSNACFQAALLYTSSKGERRIRVHTLCVPITNQLSDVFANADQQAIAALLAKMAVDRTISSSLEDARDAMMNACQDMMNAYATQVPGSQRVGALVVPYSLRLIPLYTLAMLKSVAFKLSANVLLDDRVYAHHLAKNHPTASFLQSIYPNLYPVHVLNDENVEKRGSETVPKAPLLQLSSANIDRHGVYLMDQGENMYLMVGGSVSDVFCQEVFDVSNFASIPEGMTDLPELENQTSERLRCFISHLMDSKPGGVTFLILREDSKRRNLFFQYMVEDRSESSMSYYEFLQFLQQKIKG